MIPMGPFQLRVFYDFVILFVLWQLKGSGLDPQNLFIWFLAGVSLLPGEGV